MLNKYHNTLKYQDEFLEKLMKIFKDLGLLKNTLFVIMADHGEGFGEHSRLQHDTVIYNEGLHVPVILFGAGVLSPQYIENPVSLVDIIPTILKLMGLYIKDIKNYMLVWMLYHEQLIDLYIHTVIEINIALLLLKKIGNI